MSQSSPLPETLGALIGVMRVRAKLSQKELGERVTESGVRGANQGSVSRWELDKEAPSIQQFRAIVAATKAPKRELEAGLSFLTGLPVKVVGAVPAVMVA